MATVMIPRRFNGPADSGHGGYVAGVVAELVGGSVEVVLHKPIPLETELTVDRRIDGSVHLLDADRTELVAGSPARLEIEVPELPSREEVERARSRSPRLQGEQLYPTCVACGPERAEGDGLRIFAGPVAGRDLVAAPWVPDRSMAIEGDVVGERFLWTALDCPSFGAIEPHIPRVRALLGKIRGACFASVVVGEPTTVLGWPLGVDGRKLHAASAVFSERGILCAAARMTWIAIE